MSSIRMEHIFHSYGEHTVLKDFCMDIQDGEFISVIGGSGSGKRGGNCQCHPAAEGGRFFRHRSVPQFPGAGCGGGDQSKRWIGYRRNVDRNAPEKSGGSRPAEDHSHWSSDFNRGQNPAQIYRRCTGSL